MKTTIPELGYSFGEGGQQIIEEVDDIIVPQREEQEQLQEEIPTNTTKRPTTLEID